MKEAIRDFIISIAGIGLCFCLLLNIIEAKTGPANNLNPIASNILWIGGMILFLIQLIKSAKRIWKKN